jgi:1-aminocyclopropane-1-carboxylate deaminase
MIEINDQINLKTDNQVFIKPDYLNHKYISGNKYRKLKYNIIEAKRLKKKTLLTFGGAFSNHIAAVAAAGNEFGFNTIGVIRGEELHNKIEENSTLTFAQKNGMQFKFVSRSDYRNKASECFIKNLKQEFGNFYLIPEGGTNAFAIKGCEEILTDIDKDFDFICCPVGTGGTIAGLINCSQPSQQVLGFPALKGDFLQNDISKFVKQENWKLIYDYHFGGYAKVTEELILFINQFKEKTGIPLDPIYTGKMIFGICDLMKQGFFQKNSKILAIHTGGLQGIYGVNQRLKQKGLPLIK